MKYKTKSIIIILLFLSAYIFLTTGDSSEKYIPLPYLVLELGGIIDILSNGFRGEFDDYLIYFLLVVSHLNILTLLKNQIIKIQTIITPIFFPSLFVLMNLKNNSIDKVYDSFMIYSMIPFILLWLVLIFITYKKK